MNLKYLYRDLLASDHYHMDINYQDVLTTCLPRISLCLVAVWCDYCSYMVKQTSFSQQKLEISVSRCYPRSSVSRTSVVPFVGKAASAMAGDLGHLASIPALA